MLGRLLLRWHSAASCWLGWSREWDFPVDPLGKWWELAEKGCWILAGTPFAHRGTTPPVQSELQGDLKLLAPGANMSMDWVVLPKGDGCMQAWRRRLGLEWVISHCWLPHEWRLVGGKVSIQYSCGPYFKARVEELHVSQFSNAKDYLDW